MSQQDRDRIQQDLTSLVKSFKDDDEDKGTRVIIELVGQALCDLNRIADAAEVLIKKEGKG